jgi:glycosyltransferase involved in cell wall biosynthesis
MRSDVVRYELLEEGGLWIDSDAECIRPLDERFLWPECWAAYEHELEIPGLIASGMFGARANSSFVRDMLEAVRTTDLSRPHWQSLGPELFTKIAKRHPEMIVFPSKTFYPTYYNSKPCPPSNEPTFALHHWGGTKGLRRDEEGVWLDHPPVDNPPLYEDKLPRPAMSVIIPCKGESQAKFLHEAIESVRRSTFCIAHPKDWEICLAVGGLHAEGVADYWASQPGIRVVRGVTKGLADARNQAIAIARGKYILPLDADDKLGPDMIERLLGVIGANDLAIAACSAQEFGLKGGVWPRDPNGWSHILEQNAIPLSSLYTRRLWEVLGGGTGGGYDVAAVGYEDWAFWIAASELKPSVNILVDALFHYRVHADSMSQHEWADGAKTIWEALIHLRHPSLYSASRLIGDRAALAGASGKMRARVHARAADFPAHHGLHALAGMIPEALAASEPAYVPPPPRVPRIRPITAIVPCGPGHAPFLAECVASIRGQTLQPIEIIIATSDPAALKVAKELALAPGTSVFICPGGTAAQARNKAITAATGEWIWNLDADDTCDPTFLKKAANFAWQYERPIITTDTQFFGAPELATLDRAAIGRSSSGTHRYPPPSTVLTTCPIGSCALFAKSLWETAGGFNETLTCGEDWEFWLRCIKKYDAQVTQLHECLHRYRMHADSVMERVMVDGVAEGREQKMVAEIRALHPDLYPRG